MPLTTMVTGTPAKASDINGNFSLAVLVDTAKTISVTHVWAATQQFTTLTASRPVYTDASQNLVSATVTGTGSVVQSASPTITGTLVLAAATASGLISGSAGLTISAGTSALQAITGTTLVLSSTLQSSNITSTVGNNSTIIGASVATTGWIQLVDLINTSGRLVVGIEGSGGGSVLSGSSAYAGVLGTVVAKALELGTGNTVRLSISSAGVFDFKGNSVSGMTQLQVTKIGVGMVPTNIVDVTDTGNTATTIKLLNTNVGTATQVRFQAHSDAGDFVAGITSSGFTPNAVQQAGGAFVLASVAAMTFGVAGTTLVATMTATAFTLASGVDLQLGRAYAAGAVTATGTIAIKDSTGTVYNVLVHT